MTNEEIYAEAAGGESTYLRHEPFPGGDAVRVFYRRTGMPEHAFGFVDVRWQDMTDVGPPLRRAATLVLKSKEAMAGPDGLGTIEV